jgi:hypothetical protein
VSREGEAGRRDARIRGRQLAVLDEEALGHLADTGAHPAALSFNTIRHIKISCPIL